MLKTIVLTFLLLSSFAHAGNVKGSNLLKMINQVEERLSETDLPSEANLQTIVSELETLAELLESADFIQIEHKELEAFIAQVESRRMANQSESVRKVYSSVLNSANYILSYVYRYYVNSNDVDLIVSDIEEAITSINELRDSDGREYISLKSQVSEISDELHRMHEKAVSKYNEPAHINEKYRRMKRRHTISLAHFGVGKKVQNCNLSNYIFDIRKEENRKILFRLAEGKDQTQPLRVICKKENKRNKGKAQYSEEKDEITVFYSKSKKRGGVLTMSLLGEFADTYEGTHTSNNEDMLDILKNLP